MELYKTDRIVALKSAFYELMDFNTSLFEYDTFIAKVLESLKQFLNASEVSLYKCNEWKGQLFLEYSTNPVKKGKDQPLNIACEEIEKAISEKEYFYCNFPIVDFEEYELVLPINGEGLPFGLLAFKESVEKFPSYDVTFFAVLTKECTNLLKTAANIAKIVAEEKRYKQLFRVTEKFHSSMNMDAVLGEIIYTLQEVYPSFTYFLLLSHDNNNHENLPIKDLEYDSENIAAMQAYVTGTVQIEDSIQERKSVLYAPLKGKQGVYGVLQVISSDTLVFPKNEVEFITLLANTAGSALENAQLYQQSKRLVADLQLINETSHCLNSNLRLTETINYMRGQISKSFNAKEVGFIMISSQNETKPLQGSSDFFKSNEATRYIQYIFDKINKDKESIFIGDLKFSDEKEEAKYKSIMAVPMVQSEELKGFAIVLHEQPYYFSFEMFKLLQSLIHHSTLAFTNSILREELENMVVTDHLTKLFSRNYLDEKLKESMKVDKEGAFILMDIDHFKKVNDTFGHQVGDDVLVQVAGLIKSSIRNSDIGARWGGEELAIYLPRVNLSIGKTIAERIRRKVEENTDPNITVSCGVSYWNTGLKDTTITLFKRADDALYIAKNSGRNRVVVQNQTL
ncbi:diguanylate cyclase domain-containing protein [Peribacillus tepidiphilus]|uniref:sensor domain-containing diguanylate cyclase n=1 Tax=Peribacillus tepidiphilus TaxID=2652445 RepID=UPI00129251AA|nr:diguanylate cyclase [Peribacillus tepidiphilus]